MAIQIPAFCPSCGLIFGSGIAMENVRNLTLSGNRAECPRCGAWAELPDGTFNVMNDTIEVLTASGLTRSRLRVLASILEQAQLGEMPVDTATTAVADEAPVLKPLIERFGPKMQRAFIVFLLMVIELLIAQGVSELRDDSATRKDVQQAVEEAIDKCTRQPEAQPRPKPDHAQHAPPAMHRQEVIRLAELADPQSSMLEEKEFEDCELIGPAVIGIAGPNVTFNGNHFSGTFESVLIEAPDRPIQGVIGLRNVAFQNCRFRNVAVMGPPEVLEAFARELGR